MRSTPALALAAPLAAVAVAAVALAGCHRDSNSCSPAAEKRNVLAIAESYYLNQPVPSGIDPAAFGSAQEVLDAVTANARARVPPVDRLEWNFILSTGTVQQRFGAGQSVGFGFQSFDSVVLDVFANSAADDAGLERGDVILGIGPTSPPPDGLFDVGPTTEGIVRFIRFEKAGGQVLLQRMVKRIFDLDAVPGAASLACQGAANARPAGCGARILERPGKAPVGYVFLRTFVGTADDRLRAAFAEFKAAGVRDVIVDVRYNGGGLVSTASLFADLMGAGHPGQPMFAEELNDKHTAESAAVAFATPARAEAIDPLRVAFITTGASASASELVPNVLDPYVPIAYVGARTEGKPVGQFLFDLQAGCNSVMFLVSFRLVNADGVSDYFQGLPVTTAVAPAVNSRGPLCPAADDTLFALGDEGEASTAAALAWLDGGACPAAAVAPAKIASRRLVPAASIRAPAGPPSLDRELLPLAY